jgi:hypothetical protein
VEVSFSAGKLFQVDFAINDSEVEVRRVAQLSLTA